MSKLFKLFVILGSLFWCFTLVAQQKSINPTVEASPTQGSRVITGEETIWDLLLEFDATVLSGAAGNAGAEWDGTSFYSTRWASNLIHEYSADGTTLIRQFSVPGVTGLRDLAYDGTYFYGGAAANTIYQMDFATSTLIGTIPTTEAVRHIAYDSDLDAFWVGNWSTDIVCISRAGVELFRIPANPAVTSNYGSCYDNVSPGGPFLWIFSQGGGAGTPQNINQLQLPGGAITGVAHDVLEDITGGSGSLSIAGALFSMTDYATGFFTIGGLLQGNPIGDMIFTYEIEPIGGGTTFTDDFEAYIADSQLVAQNNIDWDTWSGGGGTGEDPFVSNSFAYTGSNSVVIAPGNDLIRYHGELTSGKWYISFLMYIPTGSSGYFNSMSGFTPNPFQWAHEVYFDVGGAGRLMGVPGAPIAFSWAENTWQQAMIVVDLDTDNAEFWFGDSDPLTMIGTWQWTQGGSVNLQLDATDFFGAAATEEMYVDDYYFSDVLPPIIPVELTSFTASVNDNDVTLNWTTATELNNQGFEVQRGTNNQFRTIGFVTGFGTSTEIHNYSYVDGSVQEGSYTYRLKQVDYDGTFEYSDVVEVDVTAPKVFALEQNYPNPFNPGTTIKFSLAADSKVTLTVFDILGQEVANLISGNLAAGSHEINFNASNINSGVYFYRIDATAVDGTNFTSVKKMILTK